MYSLIAIATKILYISRTKTAIMASKADATSVLARPQDCFPIKPGQDQELKLLCIMKPKRA